MCGKETAGITAADPALYQGRTFALTPLPRTPEEALALGRALVEAAGAHPLVLEAGRHDRLAATISHLPYLLSCALVGTTEHVATEDPTVWKLAASGYHDTTRLAASDVTMMLDVLLTNREAVIQALDTCEFQLHHLKRLVEAGDEEGLLTALSAIHDRRIRPGSGPN